MSSTSYLPLYKEHNKMPFIVGHRGLYNVLENSLKGFQEAINQGIKVIELDIWLSKDDIPVVIHCRDGEDCISETVIEKKGKVNEYLCEELITFDITQDQKIPSLQQVLDITAKKAFMIIEIKEKDKKDLIIEKVLSLIETYEIKDSVIISSFHHDYYDVLRKFSNTEFKFNIENDDQLKDIKTKFKDSFNTSIACLDTLLVEEDVAYFHENNKPVSVYFDTKKNEMDDNLMKKFLSWKVDHIISDDPVLHSKMRDRLFSNTSFDSGDSDVDTSASWQT